MLRVAGLKWGSEREDVRQLSSSHRERGEIDSESATVDLGAAIYKRMNARKSLRL
jgi:hypothetical protein